jgi:hypothetical protein
MTLLLREAEWEPKLVPRIASPPYGAPAAILQTICRCRKTFSSTIHKDDAWSARTMRKSRRRD